MTPAQKAPSGSVRYNHLDSLRAILMMMGILVHTGTLEKSAVFDAVTFFSGIVRMDAFFIISGFMSLMLIRKYGGPATVKRRLITIGIPFTVALVLLNPVTNYLIYIYHNDPISIFTYLTTQDGADTDGPMVWHLHLWFLICLLIYGVLTPVVAKSIDLVAGFSMFSGLKIRPSFQFALICILVPIACLASRVVYELIFETAVTNTGFAFVLRSTLYYFPFFCLGMVLYKIRDLLDIFTRFHPVHLVLGIGMLFLSYQYFDDLPKLAAETLRLVSEAYIAIALSSTLFFLFEYFLRDENPVFRYLSDASYSVYLFHFITIYAMAQVLGAIFGETQLFLFVIVVVTFAITLFIHHFVILRVGFLRFLFNGKSAAK